MRRHAEQYAREREEYEALSVMAIRFAKDGDGDSPTWTGHSRGPPRASRAAQRYGTESAMGPCGSIGTGGDAELAGGFVGADVGGGVGGGASFPPVGPQAHSSAYSLAEQARKFRDGAT